MFTGIIEEVGIITHVSSMGAGIRFRVQAPVSTRELNVNDSVAVNGVCLTVVSTLTNEFCVEAVEETLGKTTLGSLRVGDHTNLELPLRYHERLHGHLVLGHVDTVGTIAGIADCENSKLFTIAIPSQFQKYVIPVGSVAIDGISLTVARLQDNLITVSIIPHTMEKTICKYYDLNGRVNIEFDVIGKYVERMSLGSAVSSGDDQFYSERDLRERGF